MGLIVKYNEITQILKRFINIMAVVLNTTRTIFSDFVSLKKFELQFDARTIYLSKYLNIQFDSALERIFIINDPTLIDIFIFRSSETIITDAESYFFQTAEVITDDEQIYIDKDFGLSETSFMVVLPLALVALQTDSQFIASINKYSLADKTFSIIIL